MGAYLEDSIELLKKSLKGIGLNTLIAFFFDMILVAFLTFSFMMWLNVLMSKATAVSGLPLGNIMDASAAQLNAVYSYLFWLLMSIIGGLTIIFAIFMAIYALFKGFTWCSLYKKKMTFKIFIKSFCFNSLFALLLMIPILSFVLQNKEDMFLHRNLLIAMLISAVFLFVYFSEIFFFYMSRTGLFFRSLRGTFFESFRKFYLVFPYYAAFLVISILITLIARLIPFSYGLLAVAMIELAYFAFARHVFSLVLEKYLS